MGVSFMASGDPCAALFGSMKQACENTTKLVEPNGSGGTAGSGGGGTSAGSMLTDPLGSIAKSCAQAAAWVINQVSGAVGGTSGVDFTNSGFLKQYAIVFAASTILTVVLWILAVIKRAVRGDSIVTAVTEATGFLWLAVGASAFTPVVLYGMVRLTDSVTDAIGSTTSAGTNSFLSSFANTLSPSNGSASAIGGGPILLVFISLLSMIAAALLWVELLIRAAMLYVGAALAGAVYAGLVDKDLWPHVRRWAGMMIAVDLVKPVIVIVLGLAAAISSGTAPGSPFASVLSGLAIMALSIFASGLIYRFVPNFGDDMLKLAGSRGGDAPAQVAQGALDGPATRMQQGIAAHGARSGNPVAAPALAALGAGAGLAAQGLRASARLALQRPEPQNPAGLIGPGGAGGPGTLPPQGPPLPPAGGGRGAADPARTAGAGGTGADPGGKGA